MEAFDNFEGLKQKLVANASIGEYINDSLFFEYAYCAGLVDRIFSGLRVTLDWKSDRILEEVKALIDEFRYQLPTHNDDIQIAFSKHFRKELYKRLMASLNKYIGEVCRDYNPAVSETYTFPELRDELKVFYNIFVKTSRVLFDFDPNSITTEYANYFADNHHYFYERTIQGLFMCILNNMMYLLSYHAEYVHDVLWYLDFLEDEEMITSAAYQIMKDYLAGDAGVKQPLAEPIPA